MCGLLGTTAGLAFLLVCPLMMIGMMAICLLVGPRLMRGQGGTKRQPEHGRWRSP